MRSTCGNPNSCDVQGTQGTKTVFYVLNALQQFQANAWNEEIILWYFNIATEQQT